MTKKIGILLINLGTPDSANVKDVRKYLKEFLQIPCLNAETVWVKGLAEFLKNYSAFQKQPL